MNLIQVILLGFVQGLTEFLPVSSSGHLALFQGVFSEQNIGLDILVHFATLFAVVLYFSKDIFLIIKDFFTLDKKNENFNLVWFILFASIPAGILGFLINGFVESLFSNFLNIGFGFIVSGMFLFVASFSNKVKKYSLNFNKSLIIGFSQALAIFPGVSRSGATISTGLLSGLEREKAIKFSFLMSIPVIIGANFLNFSKIINLNLEVLILGFFSAFISGFFAIFVFMKYVKIEHFRYFAFYCWILSVLSFIFYFSKIL